ncbi:MAG: NADP-dependent oxidoreductase, partial [Acetobacteraceae bacterium]|nr:NADP-dependent oxidoreductase [Acetobacteraceae bacterium]
MVDVNRRWLLKTRPAGMLKDEDLDFVEEPVPEPAEGEILVRVQMLSCDPAQRGWLDRDTYVPVVKIGEVVRSLGAGRVVKSRHSGFREGDLVAGLVGWQDYAAINPTGVSGVTKLPPDTPLEKALSTLGLNGLTAYFGLLDIGRPQPGETVVVSGAAGATGSLVGQIAKIKGCRAVGIAGGAEKCRWLTEVAGFDAAIDYKAEQVGQKLGAVCPDGIDIYFDNVGGEILDAALARLALHGRVVLCGAISIYNATEPPPGPKNYLNLLLQRGRMEGFIVLDHYDRAQEAVGALARWMAEGKLKDQVDVQ